MISARTDVHVEGIEARQIIDFFLSCRDEDYRRWWPGTHLRLHTTKRKPGDIGNVVYMDEWVGSRRLRFWGTVTELVPGKRLVWQFKLGVRLPARLILELEDDPTGVRVSHVVELGASGWGRLLDPLLRLYLSEEFNRALDEHVKTEFPKLADMLRGSVAHVA